MSSPRAVLREWDLGARILDLCLDGRGTCALARLEGGSVAFARVEDSGSDPCILRVDETGVLALCRDADDHAFLAVGAQGDLFLLEESVPAPTQVLRAEGMTTVAAAKNGIRAFACGATVRFVDIDGKIMPDKTFCARGPITSLAFDNAGARLAACHDDGAAVLSLADGKIVEIASEDSCCEIVFSPKDDVLYATCPKGRLCIWKEDQECFAHLSALPDWPNETAPILCGFDSRGSFLALGGAEQGLLVPLSEKNVALRFLGETSAQKRRVMRIAPHPSEPLAVLGYADGALMLAPFDGRPDILVHPPAGMPVTGLVWSGSGDALLAGFGASGRLALVTQKSLHAALRARM